MMDAVTPHNACNLPDLAPKPGSEIEWWFVQGWFEGPGFSRRHLMLAFFRMRDPGGTGPAGAMLLQHLLNPENGESWTDSRLTPEAVAIHDRIARHIVNTRLPAPLRELAFQQHQLEVALWNRRHGIVTDSREPDLRSDPFELTWNGFSLAQTASGLHLKMTSPKGKRLEFDLNPETGWLAADSAELHPRLESGLAYVSCPRLAVQGHAGGSPVTGQFWIDHQWGPYDNWLMTSRTDGHRFLGWDWFGINLDDGRDLLLTHHRFAGTAASRFSWGMLFENGQPRPIGALSFTPRRHWISPRSDARYPVAWDVACLEADIFLEIEPLADDQEIPVYAINSIWEGAVRATGHSQGQPVTGLGRLELFGYGKALTFSDQVGRFMLRAGRVLKNTIGIDGR